LWDKIAFYKEFTAMMYAEAIQHVLWEPFCKWQVAQAKDTTTQEQEVALFIAYIAGCEQAVNVLNRHLEFEKAKSADSSTYFSICRLQQSFSWYWRPP
jgi:hypothetical protein